MFGLWGRKRHERAGFALYTQAVRAARDPYFYTALGVPDTVDGRFDLIGLHVFLLIDRLHKEPKPGPELAQAVFDAMFSDMDGTLRELGVSDVGVARRVKQMWEALNGRSQAYAAPLASDDRDGLAAALARNVWRGAGTEEAARILADLAMSQRDNLRRQPMADLLAGTVAFLPPTLARAA